MSVKFSLARLRNPQDPDGPRKLYACAQVREEISLDRIAEEIAFSSSLTEGDVLNVLRGLAQNVVNHLADGDLVDLGDLGRFCYKLSSEGVDLVKDFSEDKNTPGTAALPPGAHLPKQDSGSEVRIRHLAQGAG